MKKIKRFFLLKKQKESFLILITIHLIYKKEFLVAEKEGFEPSQVLPPTSFRN